MISWELVGLQDVLGRLGRLSEPLDPLARRVRILLHNQHERRIATEKTDPDGAPWPPLAASTLRRKRGSMLVETGRLLGSLVSRQDGLMVSETNQARPYNVFINAGTRRMPARRYMGIGSDGRHEIEQACMDMIRRRIG